jgi:hypothetical protein
VEDVYGDGKNITNLERIHELEEMVSELESKNAKLRELLRWRKWPEEKPEETGRNPYTVILGCDCVQATFSSGRWLMDERMSFEDVADMVTHWRPIGELPKEGE